MLVYQQREFQRRLNLSDRMAQKVNASSLSSSHAWVFYNSIYVPKLFYPAKLTTFSSEEWDGIMRKFTNGILRHMGFNYHTARSIIYGPRRLGGVESVQVWRFN